MSKSTRGKMNLSSMNAAELNLCIKNGCGLMYLCKKYDCSEEQIEKRVYTLYKKTPKKARTLIRDLREIDRKAEKTARRRAEVSQKDDNLAAMDTAEIIDDAQPLGGTSVPAETSSRRNLEDLRNHKAALDNAIIETEKEHRNTIEQRHKMAAAMREILDESEELKKRLDELEESYQPLYESFMSAEEEMKRLTAEKNELTKKQERICAQIAKLEKVEIYVYDDETIIISDETSVDDTGYETLLEQLLRRQDCRRMAIWELELLARVITVVRHLEPEGKKLEVVFENSNIEAAFAKLSAEATEDATSGHTA